MWKKQREPVLANVSANNLPQEFQRLRYKGLQNLGNTCYFNSVVQTLLHCPLVRQAIETAPQSIHALRELRTLFTRMTNNDALTCVSPSECFKAVMNAPQCRVEQMSLNNRQEDVHEFFLKLLEHFDEELIKIAEVYNLLDVFNIILRSTTTCQMCFRTN